ncbi:MAG: histidine phosphatase family protein [Pseudomonadota bacterium]|nr:histidine phosphatase family protein [Pseudomonadota bacterium]MDE3038389.1 histidine phosphatase family protein [Pseudomonadota bacterium]
MMECFWIRHAPVQQTGCYTGQSDVAAIIPARPAQLAYPLPADALWFASPLRRAVQTAQWLMRSCQVDAEQLQLAPELKEQHFGAWEGRYYDEVWKTAEHSHDWSRPETIRPHGGESFADVCMRVDGWLEWLLAEQDGRSVVIVAHAGSIRAGLRHTIGMTPAQALIFKIDYGSVTRIAYAPEKKACVNCVNRSGWEQAGV